MLTGLHHVQLAIPPGGEDRARAFYGGLLGLEEVEKPDELRGRGGCWFRSAEGSVELHLGVEDGFRAARKAHPALIAGDLDALERTLTAAGVEIVRDVELEGFRRFYVSDPFGNRLELLGRG